MLGARFQHTLLPCWLRCLDKNRLLRGHFSHHLINRCLSDRLFKHLFLKHRFFCMVLFSHQFFMRRLFRKGLFGQRFIFWCTRIRLRRILPGFPKHFSLHDLFVRRIDGWQETEIVGCVPGHCRGILAVKPPAFKKVPAPNSNHCSDGLTTATEDFTLGAVPLSPAPSKTPP